MSPVTLRPAALAILSDLPDPPRSGNHLRYLQNLRLLHELGYAVSVVAGVVREDGARAGVGPFATLLDTVQVSSPSTAPVERARRPVRLMRATFESPPVNPWADSHRRASFDECVASAVGDSRFEAILIRSTFAHLIPALRRAADLIVADAHDADALYVRALGPHTKGAARLGLATRWVTARRSERALATADETWVPGEREARYFTRRRPGMRTVHVPNGVAVDPEPPQRSWEGAELVLVAGFGQPMNAAAADVLVETVLPRVRRLHPSASVTLAGRDLSEDRRRRWASLPVRCLGTVEDTAPLLERAAVLVFFPPATFGSGTPLKIAEALAAAIPVATGPVIAEALGLVDGQTAVVRSDAVSLADAIAELLAEPERRMALGLRGYAHARRRLSFESVLQGVVSTSLLADPPQSS
jgi:glycosyltransferase involved in cell wall biosynthesis